jgi:hypothetical protein
MGQAREPRAASRALAERAERSAFVARGLLELIHVIARVNTQMGEFGKGKEGRKGGGKSSQRLTTPRRSTHVIVLVQSDGDIELVGSQAATIS